MATNYRLARERAEQAIAQFLISKKELALSTPIDVPVLIRKGQLNEDTGAFRLDNPEEIPLPALVVSCPRATPHAMGYPICEVHVLLLGSTDEENANVRQSERFGLLANALPDVDVDPTQHAAVLTALNPPSSGSDSRVVQNFRVIDFFATEDQGEETGTCWIDHLTFEFHCNPTDALT